MSYITPNPPWFGYTPETNMFVLLDANDSSNRFEFYKPPQFPWRPRTIIGSNSAESLSGVLWEYFKHKNIIFPIYLKAFDYDNIGAYMSIKNNLMPLLELKTKMIFVNPGAIFTGNYYVTEISNQYDIDIVPGELLCDLSLSFRTSDS